MQQIGTPRWVMAKPKIEAEYAYLFPLGRIGYSPARPKWGRAIFKLRHIEVRIVEVNPAPVQNFFVGLASAQEKPED